MFFNMLHLFLCTFSHEKIPRSFPDGKMLKMTHPLLIVAEQKRGELGVRRRTHARCRTVPHVLGRRTVPLAKEEPPNLGSNRDEPEESKRDEG